MEGWTEAATESWAGTWEQGYLFLPFIVSTCLMMSSFRTLPSFPVPVMSLRLIPCSIAILRTAGVASVFPDGVALLCTCSCCCCSGVSWGSSWEDSCCCIPKYQDPEILNCDSSWALASFSTPLTPSFHCLGYCERLQAIKARGESKLAKLGWIDTHVHRLVER